MHRRALRRLPLPAATTTHPTPTNIPSFTQALQAAASRAWVRRASPRAKPCITGVDTPVVPCPRFTSCDRSGPSCKFAQDNFTTRGFATSRTQVTKLRAGMKTEEEYISDGAPASANACSASTTFETSLPMASGSTNKPETCGKLSHPRYGVDRTELRLGIFTSSDHLDLARDKPFRLEPQHADTQRALIETASTPPPLKPVLISQAQFPKSLPTPTSQETLYDNLRLSLTLKPLPQFPVLVDYHDSYPEFRSTKSYNLLIELSIRHAQFGVTTWLFDAMVRDKIPRDSLTRKLSIRWLVRTGRWEHAWTQATTSTADETLYKPLRNGRPPKAIRIPWYIWLELLFVCKRGALRRTRNFRWDIDEEGNPVRLPTFEIVKDPAPGTEAFTRRRRLLACAHPVLKYGANWKLLRPSLIKGAVYSTLREGRASEAAELVKAYFFMLPQKISDETAARCMGIIHLLLSADTGSGLASMYAKRRLLLSLLKMHPSFKPSPTSLFHILAPLKATKKSGTIAFKVMKAFRKSWGNEVVDTSVRRRVGSLAQKEGRTDIVQTLLDEELLARKAAKFASASVVAPATAQLSNLRGLRRPPDQVLFTSRGTQRMLWAKFKQRIRRKQRQNVCTSSNGTK